MGSLPVATPNVLACQNGFKKRYICDGHVDSRFASSNLRGSVLMDASNAMRASFKDSAYRVVLNTINGQLAPRASARLASPVRQRFLIVRLVDVNCHPAVKVRFMIRERVVMWRSPKGNGNRSKFLRGIHLVPNGRVFLPVPGQLGQLSLSARHGAMTKDVTRDVLRFMFGLVVPLFVGNSRSPIIIQDPGRTRHVTQVGGQLRVLSTNPEICRPIFVL